MDALIWILVSIAGIALISYANKTTKTIVSDPRSTYGYGPDKWLKDETNIEIAVESISKANDIHFNGEKGRIFFVEYLKKLLSSSV